jgi:hypothetical protein
MKYSTSFILYFLLIFLYNCTKESDTDKQEKNLPDIQQFKTYPSDQFLVDIHTIDAGTPFKGRRSDTPHQGAHVHWENSTNKWPMGGTSPENYPVIYAVADGIIDRIDYNFQVGENDRYGFDLAFARTGNTVFLFCYSIEPMIPEPSVDFYKQFIRVNLGQQVKKGDTIAYMYLPPSAGIGCHIHFHLQQTNKNNFFAPAIFTNDIVDSFHEKWGEFGYDGSTPIPSCMGYMLDADENPYDDGQVDILK